MGRVGNRARCLRNAFLVGAGTMPGAHPYLTRPRRDAPSRSNLNLPAELDDAIDRDTEKLGGVERQLREQHKEPLDRHQPARAPGRHDLLVADKERYIHQVEAEAAYPAHRQGARNVGLLSKAVADADGVKILV